MRRVVSPTWLDHLASALFWVMSRAKGAFSGARHFLPEFLPRFLPRFFHWASLHTGLPVVVVAAFTLVASWHIARRAGHLVVQFAVALALLLVGTKLGWIRW